MVGTTERSRVVGLALEGFTVRAEPAEIVAFCAAIGEHAPIHVDVEAARAAGHPDLLAPPTFLFALEYRRPDPHRALRELGAGLDRILHAEQRFTSVADVHAGDELAFAMQISGYTEKRGGALGFLERHTTVRRAGTLVAELHNVVAVRWGVDR